jgi:hypothetical protein
VATAAWLAMVARQAAAMVAMIPLMAGIELQPSAESKRNSLKNP